MKNRVTTVIFLGLNDILNENFDHYIHDGFLNLDSDFHLVHIMNKRSHMNFPTNIDVNDEAQVEEFINKKIDKVGALLWGDEAKKPEVKKVILFNSDPKLKAINYLNECKADSCVVITRGEQDVEGIFKDSFAYYLVAYAPCDVLVIRPS
ncbi:MAG: universal stress protein [Bacteriovoracaceae bacterium]|nr:universal stress protein [Bacteriovoracaceae bacterium]